MPPLSAIAEPVAAAVTVVAVVAVVVVITAGAAEELAPEVEMEDAWLGVCDCGWGWGWVCGGS